MPGQEQPARNFTYHHTLGQPHAKSLDFSSEKTALVLRCVHREQTTVGALLLAALASEFRKLSPVLRGADLQLHMPVDARPSLHNECDLVLSSSAAQAVSTQPNGDLWQSAHQLQTDLASSQSLTDIGNMPAWARPLSSPWQQPSQWTRWSDPTVTISI